jgi:hypothetical protein
MPELIYTFCLLVGMLLGQRFKVLILVPFIMLVLAFALAESVAPVSRFAPAEMIAAAASLQIGYLLGVCVRYLLIIEPAVGSQADSFERPEPTR